MTHEEIVDLLNSEVEILEDEEEIDIQDIKIFEQPRDLSIWSNDTLSKNQRNIIEKVNKLVKAVKQLDKKINKEDKLMDIYQRFDKYFQYSYFNETNEKVGVFSKDTPEDILREAKNIFDVIEYD